MSEILFLLAGIIFGMTIAGKPTEQCPRDIMGYKCKGKGCNHSELEIDKAYQVIGRR